jgi:twinkle protein
MANISHGPCPYPSCESSDAFNYENDKKIGHCKSCDRGYPSRERMFPWAKDKYPTNDRKDVGLVDQTHTIRENNSEGNFEPLRGITSNTMRDYNVMSYTDRQEYIYPSGGIKVRRLDQKAFYAKGGFKGDELFGMNFFPAGCSKFLTITEGELDALSVAQMMKTSYTNPVVSLPSATPSKKLWENCKDWLDSFEKIILSVDNDDAGNALADRMARLFPNRVYRIQHGEYKDANDFLVAGKGADFKSLWWKPTKHTPENILNTSEEFLKLYTDTPEHTYYPTGITALDDKIMGLMQGHFTVFKAPTGIGKTELMRYMEYSMLQQGITIAAWHLEETKLRSILGLVSYQVGDNLTRRDLIEDKDADGLVREAITNLTKDENFYQFYLGDGQGTEELCDQIRFFSQACDCKFIFFEPIQDVVVGSSEENKESMLADLSVRLSKLAAELNVGIVTIAHTNENGDPKYCKMIGQRASVIIDLHRDKEADSIEERNTTYLKVEKNRPCAEEGHAGKLRFSTETFTLREIH